MDLRLSLKKKKTKIIIILFTTRYDRSYRHYRYWQSFWRQSKSLYYYSSCLICGQVYQGMLICYHTIIYIDHSMTCSIYQANAYVVWSLLPYILLLQALQTSQMIVSNYDLTIQSWVMLIWMTLLASLEIFFYFFIFSIFKYVCFVELRSLKLELWHYVDRLALSCLISSQS